jgi:uncharacterized protein YjgD (DUF1641 family)
MHYLEALEQIRSTISQARRPLSKEDDMALLEELLADAAEWDMELDELEDES